MGRMIALKAQPYKGSDHIWAALEKHFSNVWNISLTHKITSIIHESHKTDIFVPDNHLVADFDNSPPTRIFWFKCNAVCSSKGIRFIALRCFSDRYFQTLLLLWGEKLPFLAGRGYTGKIWKGGHSYQETPHSHSRSWWPGWGDWSGGGGSNALQAMLV